VNALDRAFTGNRIPAAQSAVLTAQLAYIAQCEGDERRRWSYE
jgi:hypothetical protein